MRNRNWGLCVLAVALCVLAPAAKADIPNGLLFFTTFNADITPNTTTFNVFSVAFQYVTNTSFTLGGGGATPTTTQIFKANGADGIAFYPNSVTNLLIGGQNQNNIAQITTAGALVVNVKADSAGSPNPGGTGDPQAFHLAITPDNANLLAIPNTGAAGGTSIDVLPLGATQVSAGTAKSVSGTDQLLRGIDFCRAGTCNGQAYYTNANDNGLGNFGLLSTPLTTPTTSLVTVTNSGCANANGQGCLPSHGIVWDAFTSTFIIVSQNQVWQLQQTGASTWNVVSKFVDTSHPGDIFDQPSVDGNGHLFVADAGTGNLLFFDYASTGRVNTASFVFEHFLAGSLDDIANGGGVPPPPLPEPTSIALFGTAIVLIGTGLRRRIQKA